jgi:hypothetical protein
MTLAGLQTFYAAALAASAPLAALGTPHPFDPFETDEAFNAALSTALQTTGVFIEIGQADLQRSGPRGPRGTSATATTDILVAEALKLNHTPTDKLLVQAIADAIQAYLPHGEQPAEFETYEAGHSEQGYILHALTFTKAITL